MPKNNFISLPDLDSSLTELEGVISNKSFELSVTLNFLTLPLIDFYILT